MFTLYVLDSFCADTKTYQVQYNCLKWHKSFTLVSNIVLMRLAERNRCTNFLSSLLNIYFHPSVFQSLPLLIYFRNGLNRCLHCTKVWHKTYLIGDSQLSRLAWLASHADALTRDEPLRTSAWEARRATASQPLQKLHQNYPSCE